MQALSTFTLWFLLFVLLARFQEMFPFLLHLHLGKLSLALGLYVVLSQNAQELGYLTTKSPIKVALLTLAILAIVGVPFSIYPGNAFDRCLGFLRLLLGTSIIAALAKKNIRSFQLALLAVLVFISIQMVLQKAVGRVSVSYTYDPNDIALLCIVFLPLAIAHINQKKLSVKLLALSASAGAVASIALTGSRGGFIAMVSVALYAIIVVKKRRFMLIALMALGACVFMAMAGDALWERLQSLRDGTDYNLDAGGGRLEIWKSGLEIAAMRPIFGVGIGQFVTGLGSLTNSPWKAAHNTFLEIGVELGVGGFIAFMTILFFIYRLSLRGSKSTALTEQEKIPYTYLRLSLLGYCVGSFFLSQAYSPITYTFFCLAAIMHFELQQKEAQAASLAYQVDSASVEEKTPLTENKGHKKPSLQAPVQASEQPPVHLSAQRQKQLEQAEAQRRRKKSRLEAGDMLIQNKTRI